MARISTYHLVDNKNKLEVCWLRGECEIKHTDSAGKHHTLVFEPGSTDQLEALINGFMLEAVNSEQRFQTDRFECRVYATASEVMIYSVPKAKGTDKNPILVTTFPHSIKAEVFAILQLAKAALAEEPDS